VTGVLNRAVGAADPGLQMLFDDRRRRHADQRDADDEQDDRAQRPWHGR
jgi:hypothetical protein